MKLYEKIIIVICLIFMGYMGGVIVEFYREKGEYDLKQIETQVKHGLKDGDFFCINKTQICITPWKDGSGVIRVEE